LYFEDSEIVVALVKGLQSGCIDLVLELGDTEVFDLNRISNCPFKTYWGRRQIVDVFEQTQISSSVERFALEVNYQRLAVRNLQERLQVVSFHFLGVVINVELHLFSWLELSESWVNVEDLVVEDVFLEGLFGRWLSRIGPRFHLDFGVVWQFELPIRLDTSDILDCQSDLPGFGPVLDWDFAEVPVEDCQVPDEFIQALVRLIRVIKDFLTVVEWIQKVFIHFGHIETLPEVCNTLLVVSYVFESE